MNEIQQFYSEELHRHFDKLKSDTPSTGFTFKFRLKEDCSSRLVYEDVQKFVKWLHEEAPSSPISLSAEIKTVRIYKKGLWFILSDDPNISCQSIADQLDKPLEKQSMALACEFLKKELSKKIGEHSNPSGTFFIGKSWSDPKNGFDAMAAICRVIDVHKLSKNTQIIVTNDDGECQIIVDDR